MSAVRYVPGRGAEVRDLPTPPPGPGQVQVATAFTGICGTDLHLVHGDLDARVGAGVVPGHEMSGTVAALGPQVHGLTVGDPVVVVPTLVDGTCRTCLRGTPHLCDNLDFLGIDSDGSLQSRWNVPASAVLSLPAGLSLRSAALVEPTAVAHHDVQRAAVAPGERVLVVGAGPVGLLIAVLSRARGADVRVVELVDHRRSLAAGLGFGTFDPATDDVAAGVERWTGGQGVEVSFEVTGVGPGATTAVSALGVRGRMCLVGIHTAPRPVDLAAVFAKELTLLGARLYDRQDFTAAVAAVHDGTVPVDALISHVVPLSRFEEVLDLLAPGGDAVKVLVDCRDPSVTD